MKTNRDAVVIYNFGNGKFLSLTLMAELKNWASPNVFAYFIFLLGDSDKNCRLERKKTENVMYSIFFVYFLQQNNSILFS